MTDLERVREVLLDVQSWAIKDLDAHLKEDAEREKMLTAVDFYQDNLRLRAELAELREDRDRLQSNLLALDTAAVKRYDELREAVRAVDFHLPDVWNEYDVREWYAPLERLRQLIEEMP